MPSRNTAAASSDSGRAAPAAAGPQYGQRQLPGITKKCFAVLVQFAEPGRRNPEADGRTLADHELGPLDLHGDEFRLVVTPVDTALHADDGILFENFETERDGFAGIRISNKPLGTPGVKNDTIGYTVGTASGGGGGGGGGSSATSRLRRIVGITVS